MCGRSSKSETPTQRLGGNRCRVTFQLTFMETNLSELPGIVKLAADIGVDRVKGHHLWVHFNQMRHQSMRRSPEAIARWNGYRWIRHTRPLNASQAAERRPRAAGEHLQDSTRTSDGDIAPEGVCPFPGTVRRGWPPTADSTRAALPTRCARPSGTSGTSTDTSLYDIWKSRGVQGAPGQLPGECAVPGLQHEAAGRSHEGPSGGNTGYPEDASHHVCQGKACLSVPDSSRY